MLSAAWLVAADEPAQAGGPFMGVFNRRPAEIGRVLPRPANPGYWNIDALANLSSDHTGPVSSTENALIEKVKFFSGEISIFA